ncbi:trypsin-like serine protease [Oceanospirillum sediminis]|uniref:Trypsin-like serine protease n=1 Tax=Oceanospirillum sediminis TaxID=2760088 RepID=A0A839IWJ6_9GAMM|nr:trypsin-like serine protease [Oceanospirillum sediminis]MBB1488747.1 trypsin-like serine protease [Oceanospirillum sediminis]
MKIHDTATVTYTPKVAVPSSNPNDADYIVSPGGQYDGVVQIEDGYYTGTGALLSTGRHILTAAHVVDDMKLSDIAISFDLTSGRQTLSASQVHIHSNWNEDWGYDIAIIELAEDAPTTGYEIYRGNSEIDSDFRLVGYGIKGTGNTGVWDYDPELGLIKRTGMNTYEALDEDFNFSFGDTPDGSMLFYDFDNGTQKRDALGGLIGKVDTGLGALEVTSTGGDSGGPNFITVDGQLQIAGIVTGGNNLGASYDAITGINSSFGEVSHDTRVSYFADWIDDIAGTSPDSNTTNTTDNTTGDFENNDTYLVQRGFISKGKGDDVYIFSTNLIDNNAQITITDTQGSNSLQFAGGLSISSSTVASDALLLTLSNDAVVTILGASDMSYRLGGDPLSGTEGVDKSFASFVSDVLGVDVPTSGTSEGGSANVNSDGSVTTFSANSFQQNISRPDDHAKKQMSHTIDSPDLRLTGVDDWSFLSAIDPWG